METILKLNHKNNLFIKLHPNHDCSGCLKFLINNINKKYSVSILKSRFDFSEDLLISSTTSAIYTLNCLSGINLLSIFQKYKDKNNIHMKNIYAYNAATYKFLKSPKHIYNPESIMEIENYFK